MKIEKYKSKKNGEYEVYIDNDKYIFYEDVIIKHNLLLKKDLDKKEIDKMLKENMYYEGYYLSLKYLGIKMRSKKEIKKYLNNKIEKKQIDDIIKRLYKEGYLNDRVYAKAYIYDTINLKMDGPLKIKKDLTSHEIPENIILEELTLFDKNTIEEKINKLITKEIKMNTNKSKDMLKKKIELDLLNKGYDHNDIISILDLYEIDDSKIYKKEYEKELRKLSAKYSGKELEFKLKQKMYQKGFRY